MSGSEPDPPPLSADDERAVQLIVEQIVGKAWICPPVTDEQLRAAGLTAHAKQFPRSEIGARWVAAFNNIPFEKMPAAWCYASNEYMWHFVETRANEACASRGGDTIAAGEGE